MKSLLSAGTFLPIAVLKIYLPKGQVVRAFSVVQPKIYLSRAIGRVGISSPDVYIYICVRVCEQKSSVGEDTLLVVRYAFAITAVCQDRLKVSGVMLLPPLPSLPPHLYLFPPYLLLCLPFYPCSTPSPYLPLPLYSLPPFPLSCIPPPSTSHSTPALPLLPTCLPSTSLPLILPTSSPLYLPFYPCSTPSPYLPLPLYHLSLFLSCLPPPLPPILPLLPTSLFLSTLYLPSPYLAYLLLYLPFYTCSTPSSYLPLPLYYLPPFPLSRLYPCFIIIIVI